jgi:hypothetical protein
MATTWIKPLHRTGSNSVSAALERSIEYAKDYDKTDAGEYIFSYECDAYTAQADFLLAKAQYERNTGRNQGKHDIVAYHIRQSFPPGEMTAEEALELGRELAMRWTKGRHQFVVAAHTNTNNPHTHIIYNSTSLDFNRKFKNFKFSTFALRKLSDQICLEHGLSVIEKPKQSKGWNRAEYLGNKKTADK